MGNNEPPAPVDPLLEAARPFGVSYLFPYQRLVISNVLEAADVGTAEGPAADAGAPDPEPGSDDRDNDHINRQIVVLPTGAGKTLCFQLPAAVLPGITVVVYPLLSLMADQVRRAEAAGLGCAVLKGGLSRGERTRLWESAEGGRLQVLLTNPEMLSQETILSRLAERDVAHLVIDEAHCVSEWGETFRPSYLELGRVIGRLRPQVTTAFTATASPPVLEAVRTHLFGGEGAHLIQAVPDRPNISYSVIDTPSKSFALRLLLAGAAIRCETT